MDHLRQTTTDERTEAPNSPDTAVSMGQMTTWMQTIENNLLSLTKEIKDLKFQRKFQPRGKINNTQNFSTERFTSEAVVTELQVDGILGLDFMKKNNCLVDVSENIFHIDNLSVPLIFQGTLGCFRVVSTESVTIPARSEIVVSMKVCLTEGQTLPTNDVLVEASENKGKDYILTARSLVKSNDSIPVRLMNIENEAKTIFPGTTIAQMCEISHVAKSLPFQNDGQNKKGLRSDLHDLLNRTSDKLSRSEKQKVKSLVQEYESLFAETDSDLGKTSLVKHEIETGNARPFKEPPRRTPFSFIEGC
ncbi:unnamed protein product [Mytilus coruscus]|uniref:Uncharacterized protein n=1 Tax=Mytilus coruscus TaxID=42192 RepID=A0A6J8E524_MYTCO|nr:unnamed protein product [Mytilus coruscus]